MAMQRQRTLLQMPDWVQELSGEPRAEIGTWPTPVHRMDNASQALGVDIWVKREDLAGAWGGNKVRKLEFWLARHDVWKAGGVIVSGAGASTWTAATALHAHRLGLGVTAALAGEIPADRWELYTELGTRVVQTRSLNAMPLAWAKARLLTPRRKALPMGGSGWPGDLGSYLCGAEIIEDGLHRSFPRPRAIFVAAGTAGTAAGIAAALAHRRQRIPIVAVRVAPRPWATARVVTRHAKHLLKKMHALPDERRLSIVGEGGFFGEGYGKPARGVDEAIELAAADGVELEPTYTGKAFAALASHALRGMGGPLLFIHTAAGSTPRVGR